MIRLAVAFDERGKVAGVLVAQGGQGGGICLFGGKFAQQGMNGVTAVFHLEQRLVHKNVELCFRGVGDFLGSFQRERTRKDGQAGKNGAQLGGQL